MSELEQFESVWNSYKKSSKTEEDKQQILELARKNPSNMWAVFFSSDRDMCNRFLMLEVSK